MEEELQKAEEEFYSNTDDPLSSTCSKGMDVAFKDHEDIDRAKAAAKADFNAAQSNTSSYIC